MGFVLLVLFLYLIVNSVVEGIVYTIITGFAVYSLASFGLTANIPYSKVRPPILRILSMIAIPFMVALSFWIHRKDGDFAGFIIFVASLVLITRFMNHLKRSKKPYVYPLIIIGIPLLFFCSFIPFLLFDNVNSFWLYSGYLIVFWCLDCVIKYRQEVRFK